jgi:ABC-type transport system involved in multi-copper enzyme maturation permease subunit
MLSALSSLLLWAQADSAPPPWLYKRINWLLIWGDPSATLEGPLGGLITFAKIVGLFSLLGWVGGWVVGAIKDRNAPKAKWLDLAALISLLGCLVAVVIATLQSTKRLPAINIGGFTLAAVVAVPFLVVLFVWVERALWMTIGRLGKRADLVTLGLVHAALVAGITAGYVFLRVKFNVSDPLSSIFIGLTFAATYMGLVVFGRVLMLLAGELVSIRARRLYAIARLTVVEANRRMWAPWVVLTVFAVILAFTHWFLQAPDQRPAEVGRLYIGTLTLLCSLLITVMVSVLTPISLPQDIQNQTIYTVVSKPVRRLELVWGRMIGFMALVTVLIAVFGGISLLYLQRNVGGTIKETEAKAVELQESDPARAKQLREQADQLRTRMSARKPIKGSLTFLDSRGNPQLKGIDVGQETENRSHIEGATPATAKWEYGLEVVDPYDSKSRLNRRIPVEQLLTPGTIEEIENRAMIMEYGVDAVKRGQVTVKGESDKAKLASETTRLSSEIQKLRAESQKLQKQANDLEAQADEAEKAGDAPRAQSLRLDATNLHSPPLQLEMTFTIYRTTKGRVGEPVYAEMEVTNPNPRVELPAFRNIFPIREYYTNKQLVPASYLVGSNGALKVEIRCISPTQYLGMGENDLYILQQRGNFGLNFMFGLGGIWLQAMVLTAIGVFAGTFLSWPMALLTTIAFYIAGQVAFQFFADIARQSLYGGGPFESLIRLVTHDNQMTELTPTLAVIVAKTLDSLTMPLLTRLAYIVPNFGALDVSNTVAEGFAVDPTLMINNVLLALAYALPFSIGGYFILKNREVAA